MATNPDNLATKVVDFVGASSTLGQRAMDKIAEFEGQHKAATTKVAGLVQHLIECKVIEPGQAKQAEAALANHSQALELLRNSSSKIAELRKEAETRKGMNLGAPAGQEKAASSKAYDSQTDPYVGRRTTEKKASDHAIMAGLGLE